MNIKELLKYAIDHKASDLHLSSGTQPIVRVDGDLFKVEGQAILEQDKLLQLLADILPPERFEELKKYFEVDLSIALPEFQARFRVNVFFQLRGVSAVFRIIPFKILSLKELGMPEVIYNLTQLPHGLVLMTGPTGCGKSTTLAAMINYINTTRNSHIVTIEDPIEFVYKSDHSLIQQREVHQHTRSFNNALRSVLREDPDVILVGEMRDLETIRLAMTAAETGHLVFATLHTSSAAKTVNRIIDVFPSGEKDLVRTMLSESLRAVISQILIKRVVSGRAAAQEIMICNPAISNMIRENKVPQIKSVIQTSKEAGMQTLENSLLHLAKENIVDRAIVESLVPGITEGEDISGDGTTTAPPPPSQPPAK